jgi:hypothetical protein
MPGKSDANVPQDSLTREGSVPFFTRFLEGQNDEPPQAAGGDQNELLTTLKYPSDRDEMDLR